MTKPIELPASDLLHALFSYDPETGKFFWKERSASMDCGLMSAGWWNARYAGRETGWVDQKGYVIIELYNKKCRAHRIAWQMSGRPWTGEQIDHINGDKSDNRISNLRCVSNAENAKNAKIGSRNKSGVVGVCWIERDARWAAHIQVNGKTKNLGMFQSFTDACRARKTAEAELGFHPNHGRSGRGIDSPSRLYPERNL